MKVRMDTAAVAGDLADHAASELQDRDDHVEVLELRARGRQPVAVGGDLDDPIAGQPGEQIHHVDAAAEHQAVAIDLAPPTFEQLVDAPVVVVALDVKQSTKLAGGNSLLEVDEPRCAAPRGPSGGWVALIGQ